MHATNLFLFAALGLVVLLLSMSGVLGDAPPEKRNNLPKVVLVIHGGAGVLDKPDLKDVGLTEEQHREQYEKALTAALAAGYRVWQQEKKTSVDVVEAAIRSMEDAGIFNAGKGAAFNHDGRVELDAGIMAGNTRAGAVAVVAHVKNPISAARSVMEMDDQRHVLLVGPGAEAFVLDEKIKKKYDIERVSNVYFWTDRRLNQIRKKLTEEKKGDARGRERDADSYFGTVGAVAVDRQGHLAAGTSTGGLPNKLPGRVGDSPLIGAGTYADDRACAVSCTGTGEVFIRHVVAHDVVARMLYKNDSVAKAAADAIAQLPDEKDGVGGLIALDRDGHHHVAMSAKSLGMYRGHVTADGDIYVAIYRENPKKMDKGK